MKLNRLYSFSVILGIGLLNCVSQSAVKSQQKSEPKKQSESKQRSDEVKSRTVTIAAVGDVMLGEHLNGMLKSKGACWPFEKTASYLKSADIAFCNLESPISEIDIGRKLSKEDANLRADPIAAKSLACAGIDVVSLANNHSLDYDVPALERTITLLKENNIKYVGVRDTSQPRTPLIIEKNGLKIAFLAYLDGVPESFTGKKLEIIPLLLPYVQDDIYEARKTADMVIVSFHFGKEFSSTPDVYQMQMAREAIDAGADIVLGHHPHTLQPLEKYNGKLIAYSLGNFIFGHYGKASEGAILKVKLSSPAKGAKTKIDEIDAIPVNVYNNDVQFQPQLFEDSKKDQIIKFLFKDIK